VLDSTEMVQRKLINFHYMKEYIRNFQFWNGLTPNLRKRLKKLTLLPSLNRIMKLSARVPKILALLSSSMVVNHQELLDKYKS